MSEPTSSPSGAARAAILARLQAVATAPHLTATAHPGPYTPPFGSVSPAPTRRARFVAQLEASGARVIERDGGPDIDGATLTDDSRFRGHVGVAESGAIWVVPTSPHARQQLFLAEHVTLVLSERAIVETLHEAYAQIDVAGASFGCFVAGPSKTADIEQTLVIGAHGPLALTVYLIGREPGAGGSA
jgi:L-lactate dehydrogenase complex protein LldG